MKFGENYKYELIEGQEEGLNAGDVKIRKTGLTAEFTLNDIDRDRQYLEKKKEEILGKMQIEDAKMQNIDRTNPEIGQMDEHVRQVIYIYQQAFAVCKVGKEKVAEIDKTLEELKHEMMDISIQTGILTTHDGGTEGKESGDTEGPESV
jgi:hypothetical protein